MPVVLDMTLRFTLISTAALKRTLFSISPPTPEVELPTSPYTSKYKAGIVNLPNNYREVVWLSSKGHHPTIQ